MNTTERYAIHIVKSELCDHRANAVPADVNLDDLLLFVKKHKLDNLAYRALLKNHTPLPQKWENEFNHSIYVEAVQQVALESIIGVFDEKHIEHIPLKGSVLKNYYPLPDMRQQGDIDILVHKKDMVSARRALSELGYTFKEHDAYEGHDTFYGDGVICLEIHGDMLKPIDIGYKRFSKIWYKAIKRDKEGFCFDIPNEEMYIYMVLHLIKHLSEGGAGIRMVMDIWIMDSVWSQTLNYSDIEKYMGQVGVLSAYKRIRNISHYWFGNNVKLNEQEKNLADYICGSSIYGDKSKKHFLEYAQLDGMDSNRAKRFKGYFNKVFKRYNLMRKEFDILNKYPFLLPVMWIYRILRILIFQRGKMKNTRTEFDNIDIDKLVASVEYKRQLYNMIGIEEKG